MLRLFIAIALPADALALLSAIQNDLVKHAPFPIEKVSEEKLHVTLRFLGNVDGKNVPDLISRLSEIAPGPFEICFNQIELVRRQRKNGLIWARAAENLLLNKKRGEIDKALGLFFLEERPFFPHVTLFRFKSAKKLTTMKSLVSSIKVDIKVLGSGFSLMQSTLHPSGSVYSEIMRFS